MRRIYTISGLLTTVFFLAVGCNDKGPQPDPPKTKSTKNTLLVYLGTDNKDFYSEAWEKPEILVENWNDSYDGNMLVFADVSSRTNLGTSADEYGHLVLIGPKNSKGERADTVKSYFKPDSSDPAFLKQVLNDVQSMFPADRMGLCVLSHALGWLPLDLYQTPSRSLIEDNGSYMELAAFAEAIPYKLDYLIFDLCFMAGVEVAYELKDKADYIISSPAEVVVPGFAYDKMMGRLFKSNVTEADYIGVAYDFYKMFADGFYSEPMYNTATVSVVKTSELDALAEYVRDHDLLPWLETESYLSATQNYHPTRYYYSDMGDLVVQMYGEGSAEEVAFKKRLENTVVDKYNTPFYYSAMNRRANAIKYFSGLTVYVPRAQYPNLNEYYKGLKWYKAVYENPDTPKTKSTNNTLLLYLGTDNKDFYSEAWEKPEILLDNWRDTYDGNMLVFADVSGRTNLGNRADEYGHLIWIGPQNRKGERADTVKSYYKPDSSDPAFLKEVLNDVKTMFPAEKMGLCVLSHALGWLPLDLYQTPSRSLIEDNGSYMELAAFAEAIPYKLDYLIFDLCFMAGVEVAYELKDKADYIIASPAEVVVPGFAYDKMMGRLFKSNVTEADYIGVAYDFYKMFADGYYSEPMYNAATVSVVKTSELDELAKYVRDLDLLPWLGTEDHLSETQNYHPTRYYYSDMVDLVIQIYGEGSAEEVAFKKRLENIVVDKYNTPFYYSAMNRKANAIKYFSGMTVYIPRAKYPNLNEYYTGLKWYKAVYE